MVAQGLGLEQQAQEILQMGVVRDFDDHVSAGLGQLGVSPHSNLPLSEMLHETERADYFVPAEWRELKEVGMVQVVPSGAGGFEGGLGCVDSLGVVHALDAIAEAPMHPGQDLAGHAADFQARPIAAGRQDVLDNRMARRGLGLGGSTTLGPDFVPELPTRQIPRLDRGAVGLRKVSVRGTTASWCGDFPCHGARDYSSGGRGVAMEYARA
jgi:hypothetical protein